LRACRDRSRGWIAQEGKVHPTDDGDGNPFVATDAPPPPYESVVLKDGVRSPGAGAHFLPAVAVH